LDYQEIKSKIDDDFTKRHLTEIQRFIRQPSVSADGTGIAETIDMLVSKLKGFGADNVEIADMNTEEDEVGHPLIYGELISDPKKPTILFYSMYDVQPVFPEKWVFNDRKIDPFGGEILEFEWLKGHKGQCLLGRGVSNQKGPTIAFLNVLEAYLSEYNELPVNIIFALEGEEELGSIHIGPFIDKYFDKLKRADSLLFPAFWEDTFGKIKFLLGVRGAVVMKLSCTGGDWGAPSVTNIHSSSSGIIENPIFKLVSCLYSLKNDETNEILVPDIMDDPNIIGPNEEDISKGYLEIEKQTYQKLGVKKFRIGMNGLELDNQEFISEMLYKPGLSINGIEGGYYDEGTMTIIPYTVKANLDIRLPPFQQKQYVIDKYTSFIKTNFPMINIQIKKGGYESAKVPFSHPLAQYSYRLYQEFKKEVAVLPLIAGSAPFSIFQSKLQIPFIVAGMGHSGRVHSPLEYAVLNADDPKVGGIIDFEYLIAKYLLNYKSVKS
jgi:acetylornithine deacetylase/succinyl-diaminopimelate desuccinylase-like protein